MVRKGKIFFLIGLILLIVYAFELKAQKKYYSIEKFEIGSGLSSSTIHYVFVDSIGFLWISTQDGLNKYDGYTFLNYRNALDENSISSNNVRGIAQQGRRYIWIASENGLNRFDRQDCKFDVFSIKPIHDPSWLQESNIFDIYCDHGGRIWVKTLDGIYLYFPKENYFRKFPYSFDPLSESVDFNKFGILEDGLGNIWLGSKDGLISIHLKDYSLKKFANKKDDLQSLSSNEIRCSALDRGGNFYIGTSNGLNYYNAKTNSFERFYIDQIKKDGNYDESNCIKTILKDKSGKIWIGNDKGVYIFDPNTKKFKNQNISFNGLPVLKVTSIAQDRSGLYWIGTYKGLFKLNLNKPKFQIINSFTHGISSNNLRGLFYEKDCTLWIGTRNDGLNILNLKTKQLEVFRNNNPKKKISDDFITCIFKDSKGTIWVATRNGINIFDPTKRTFKIFEPTLDESVPEKMPFQNNKINDICEDSEGYIWFASGHGVYKWRDEKLRAYHHNKYYVSSICSNESYCFLISKEKELWIGTLKGLCKYNKFTDGFIPYVRLSNDSKGLSNNSILDLYQSEDGIFWIATEAGLNKFNQKTKEFTFFTIKNGFVNDYIYQIVPDRSNNLWLSTNKGIASFNMNNNTIRNFDVSDGLQGWEYNLGSSLTTPSGHIVFGGTEGLNFFHPDSIYVNKNLPSLCITKVETTSKGNTKSVHSDIVDHIKIYPEDYLVNIYVSGLELTKPEKNNFAYRIKELDMEWIQIGTRNYITLSHLTAGLYTLEIKGSNCDQVWNEECILIHIEVIPIFLKSKPALFLFSVTFSLLIFFFIQYRTRKLRKSNKELLEKQIISLQVEQQKEELANKNKNITDSINYASRIIKAIMPKDEQFRKLFPDSFIYFHPKDIVSGDFYWITERDGKIFIAVVDCTGHGVPGAFMSIIGFDLLRVIVKEQNVDDAAEILNRLDLGIAEIFGHSTSSTVVLDGMDMSFCIIDKEKKQLQFAGAMHFVYLLRDNNIMEIKGDRYPVGFKHSNKQHFTQKIIDLKIEDMLYLFTDGFTDQFGGPVYKKYKYIRFRHLLLTLHKFKMDKQKEAIMKSFETWRGDMEQIDDVLVIGINLSSLWYESAIFESMDT